MKASNRDPSLLHGETPLVDDPVRQRLADLESTRSHLVRTVLSTLATSISTGLVCDPPAHRSKYTQRLLSAAIRDLHDLDNRLDQTRNLLQKKAKHVDDTSTVTPEDSFPSDLTTLAMTDIEVLNSRVHRQLDAEYLDCDPQLETQTRLDELNLELNRRARSEPTER